jgi:hypothetical protein
MRKLLSIAALAAFLAVEIPLSAWMFKTYTVSQIFEDLADPVSLALMADFAFFAGAVFLWIVQDAKRSGHSMWKWLPAFIVSPSAFLFVYLILRKPEPRS